MIFLAFLGFIVLAAAGLWCIAAVIVLHTVLIGFGPLNKEETLVSYVLLLIGMALEYFAFHLAPFTISLAVH